MKLDKRMLGVVIAVMAGLAIIITTAAFFEVKREAGMPVFYYSLTCPHCKNVEDYLAANRTEEKLKIVKKEVSQSRDNAEEFLARAGECGFKPEEAGVPLLWTEGKCIVGDQEIINYFKQADEQK